MFFAYLNKNKNKKLKNAFNNVNNNYKAPVIYLITNLANE